MEIHQLNFNLSSLLLFSFFIFLLIKAWNKSNSPKKYQKLPPSPLKLPLIGHVHHLFGGLPHRTLRKVSQKYGSVLHLQLGEVSAVVISSPEAAKEVIKLQDPACAERHESIDNKIMRYENSDVAFTPYNEYWRQMRKLFLLKFLSAKSIKSFASIRQDEILHLIKSLETSSGEVVDLTERIFKLVSSITCRAAFGKSLRDPDSSLAIMLESMSMTGGFMFEDLFPSHKLLHLFSGNKRKLLRIHRKLDLLLDEILEEHKLKQSGETEYDSEDIIDVILRMQRTGELQIRITDHDIKGVIFEIFSAATHTTSAATDWAMVQLMKNPRVMAKAQTEVRQACKGKKEVEESNVQTLKYLKLVVKETFRLNPPVPLIPRASRDECQVDGYSIPLKSRVIVNAWSMARDPKYWDEPESFKPERFENSTMDFVGNNFEFLPFGAGRRNCPGMNFGLASIELSLAQLLYHFDWEMPKGMTPDDIDMTELPGIIVSKKNGLFVVPKLYKSPIDHQD